MTVVYFYLFQCVVKISSKTILPFERYWRWCDRQTDGQTDRQRRSNIHFTFSECIKIQSLNTSNNSCLQGKSLRKLPGNFEWCLILEIRSNNGLNMPNTRKFLSFEQLETAKKDIKYLSISKNHLWQIFYKKKLPGIFELDLIPLVNWSHEGRNLIWKF